MLDRALPPALFSLILVVSQAAAFPSNFKHSVLAPRDGPRASYNPPPNPKSLPYDVAGVVGGYVLTVLIWGILLLTIGRRMRRKALDPPKALELELQNKPIRPSIRTAPLASPPLSARSATSWLRRFKKSDSAVDSPQSPVIGSPTSFDQKVIDDHKERAQVDLERLYAAVMDHDSKKNYSNVDVNEMEQQQRQSTSTSERRRPSAISTSHPADDASTPISPIKAIYPPDYHTGPQTAPLPQPHLRDAPPASPRSILSKRSQASTTKSTRFNLKNLRISGPIQKYPGVASDDEAHTPLSPRFYHNPGAPPSPPTQTNSPTTPYSIGEAQDTVPALPSARALPLRSFAQPLQSPGIQTTVLDRRNERLGLQTPRTGVPFTPYSPYMPFTPITPVTPHLVGRKERKERKKERRGVDMVQSPKEIFGDAY
jgi:hypothetical protein